MSRSCAGRRLPCRHLSASEEAWEHDPESGVDTPFVRWLCGWVPPWPRSGQPQPVWVASALAAGHPVRPEHECQSCPVYSPAPPEAEARRARMRTKGDTTT